MHDSAVREHDDERWSTTSEVVRDGGGTTVEAVGDSGGSEQRDVRGREQRDGTVED